MRTLILVVALLAVASGASSQTTPGPRPPEGWVVLSVESYRALRDKAFPPPPSLPPPPVPAAISRVEYDLAVDGQAAAGQVKLVADVFKDGWVFLPIPPGLRVREARLDGRPVALVSDRGAGKAAGQSLLISRPGRSTVLLDVTLPVSSQSGTESLSLPISTAPLQKATLTIAVPDATLSVTGGLVDQRSVQAAPPATRFVVCGRPGEGMTLGWGRRAAAPASRRPLRLRGSVTELVGAGEDGSQVSAQIALDIVEGAAERAILRLPTGFAVGQVTGPLVADWEARPDGTLTVTLVEPVERAARFTITGEARTGRDGRLQVPLIRLAGAERETGAVAVEVLGAGEITDQAARGLDAADAADLGETIAARQSPALVAFRFRPLPSDAPRSLEVTVARYTAQAVLLANVDEARYRALLTEDGKALVQARFAVRNSQRSFLGLTLPKDAALWTALVDGRPVRPGRTAEGALLLPILKDHTREEAGSVIELLYLVRSAAWPGEGAAALELPVLDLPVSRTGLVVHHSPRYRLTLEAGPFREQSYTPPEQPLLARADSGLPHMAPSNAPREAKDEKATKESSDLAAAYQRGARGGAGAGRLPVPVAFPSIGPWRFLAAELTAEGKSLQARFTFKRQVK